MATIQEILDKINASKSNNVNNNSFIDLMRQISGNPEDAIQPVNDTNSIYGHIVQMYTTLYDGGIDYAILADEVDMLQGVYDNLIAINSVHADKTKLDSLYADKLTLDSLYADKDKLDQLFADKAIMDRVYGSIDNIDRVHTSIDKLDVVYADILNIDTVSNNLANIDIVAESDDNITIVADNVTDVNIVADNIAVLNEIYNNRVEIYSADDNATIATIKAAEASASATASASSASAAADSAGTSTTKANEASASAAAALVSRNDVSTMKLAVETIYDTFDDRFLGTKTTNPVLDNDDNALIDGAIYFNTADNAMKVYDLGTTTWYSIPQIYLSGLLDVELISITTGDILVWNGTKWSNTANPKVDSIQFNGGSGTEGTVSWNSDEGTLDLVANTTTLQIGQETYIHVLNQSGSTILDGTVVMAVGTLGASGRILVQPYDGVSLPKYILGIATESLVTGQSGKVTNFGKIRGLNTSAWNEGDELFVTINGGLTNVEPATGINVAIAYVINKHANNGTVMVRFTPYDENLSYTKAESDTLLSGHTDSVNNPHAVTKAQVGLGSVDNTSDLDKPVSTDTQTVLDLKAPLDSAALVNPTINGIAQSGYSGFKNYIINGNFDIWQRGISQTASGYGSDDRCINDSVGSTKTHSRQTCTDTERALFNAQYYSRTVVSSIVGTSNFVDKLHRIEDVTKLAGKTVTLSFWAKADSTKNISVEFGQGFGTGGTPSSSVMGNNVTTFNLTATWQKFTKTLTFPSIVGKTLGTDGVHTSFSFLLFWFDAGSALNTRANSLGQQSGTFDIAQVQLEEGSVATPFEQRPIGLELSLCQRYYESSSDDWGGGSSRWCGYTISGVPYTATTKYKVRKRVVPTVVLSNVYVSGFTSTVGSVNGGIDGFAEDREANATLNSATFVSSYTASAEL